MIGIPKFIKLFQFLRIDAIKIETVYPNKPPHVCLHGILDPQQVGGRLFGLELSHQLHLSVPRRVVHVFVPRLDTEDSLETQVPNQQELPKSQHHSSRLTQQPTESSIDFP